MLTRMTGELPRASRVPADDSLDYKALYRAKVTAQNGNPGDPAQTLDITPVDTRFQSFQNVPCMFGVPGVVCTVQPGSYVFFTFWNGQPGQVYVASWDPMNAVVEMDLTSTLIKLNNGSLAVARATDPVSVTITTAEIAAMGLVAGSGPSALPVTATNDGTATGTITSGNPTILA